MKAALVADLAALGEHEIVATPSAADAIWLIAPEIGGCLERLAARVERTDQLLLGSGADAIRRAADKANLARLLARGGVPYPETRLVRTDGDSRAAVEQFGYPLVVKPRRGAGSAGVSLVRNRSQLLKAVSAARAVGPDPVLLQRYVRGKAVSVSLLADGTHAAVLTVNGQSFGRRSGFSYRGGITPLDHPLAHIAAHRARRACEAVGGLRGFVGVDLVLTKTDAVVIEINPRLTTAYLGVRAAIDVNIAALALTACAGRLPARPRARRRVRFTAAGRIASA